MEVKTNWPLQKYTTFGVDVDCQYFVEVTEESELIRVLKDSDFASCSKIVLGGGSNVLFLKDFSGMVIHPENKTLEILVQAGGDIRIKVGAGYVWEDLVKYTVERGWWGLENLAGIPGRVGGAVVQNVGAYGAEIQDCVEEVIVIRKDTFKKEIIPVSACAYAYRSSLFKRKDSPYIVWEVVLSLDTYSGPNLQYKDLSDKWNSAEGEITPGEVMGEVNRLRKNKLPDPKVLCSAGSFFANPLIPNWHFERLKNEYSLNGHSSSEGVKISAAWLIEQCGWKGYREADAGVYEKQALVLVNYGNASGEDIWDLAKRIQDSVEKKFEISLQPEVCVFGTEEDEREIRYGVILEKMYHSLPMFQRIGAAAYKADMKNTEKLMEALREPYKRFKSIHVAGTNGKGSCSHLIASVLQAAGFKTGLYTSPHLRDFRERIRINGEMIPKEKVVDFYQAQEALFDKIKASFFEMTVAMAFDYFARERVDVAIIEVGMGGRLDSTNVVVPEVSVITNISLDHIQFLGDSLSKIAEEKAGIIKENIPVVVGETQVQTLPVFQRKAKEMNAKMLVADHVFSVAKVETESGYTVDVYRHGSLYLPSLVCALEGETYQCKNIVTVMATLELLKEKYQIGEANIRDGFSSVVSRTGLKGRWEKLSDHPRVYADTGHNEGGVALVLKQIEQMSFKTLRVVWGMVKDKDIEKVLTLLPVQAVYYFCAAPIERALPAEEMAQKGNAHGLKGKAYASVQEALGAAKADAFGEDLIYVGGSTFVVAEVC